MLVGPSSWWSGCGRRGRTRTDNHWFGDQSSAKLSCACALGCLASRWFSVPPAARAIRLDGRMVLLVLLGRVRPLLALGASELDDRPSLVSWPSGGYLQYLGDGAAPTVWPPADGEALAVSRRWSSPARRSSARCRRASPSRRRRAARWAGDVDGAQVELRPVAVVERRVAAALLRWESRRPGRGSGCGAWPCRPWRDRPRSVIVALVPRRVPMLSPARPSSRAAS